VNYKDVLYGKAANKGSTYVETPSRLWEKQPISIENLKR
jgi:hypothetical protein